MDEAALRDAMVMGEGGRRAGRMIGLDTLDRNLLQEDEAFARVLNRKRPAAGSAVDDEQMQRIVAGGNVTFYNGAPPAAAEPVKPAPATEPEKPATEPDKPAPAPTTPAPTATTSTSTTATSTTTTRKRPQWWPAAIVATSLLGGAGGGYIAYDLLHPARDTDTDTTTVLDFPTQGK